MRVAVTGGSGFIGSHVVDHLLMAGHDVRVIDTSARWLNPAADHCDADLFDDDAMDRALADREAVFHLAAVADVNDVDADPVRAVRLNVEGTARILAAARRQGCERVILASTVWVYGATAGEGERDENALVDLTRAGHVYVSTKLAAEMLMHSYRQMYGQQFTILRYGIPYGPRMRDALVVARFVRLALDGKPITIAGTGDQQRHYVYVEDIADAHVRALAPAAANQTLALEGGTGVSVREIADTVRSLVGETAIEHVPARNADYSGVSVSNTLAKELLDWAPVTSFADGVQRYLDWLRSQPAGSPPAARPAAGSQPPAGS